MDTKKKYSLLIGLILTINILANNLNLPSEVITGMSSGKAELISKYFSNTVELTINSKEDIYSKTQAQIILKDFFKKNIPQSFSILHEGGKGESRYAIGSLKTSRGKYRVTILLKASDSKPLIHQLRIERDDV